MPTRYLCLDDEAAKVQPIVQLLEQANADLRIEVRAPIQFDEEIRQLGKAKFDGLLLDLRLDRTADRDGKRVNYRALSLAQELRTRMTEGEIASFPLVLWSVDDNFKASYDKDETSHDLFDKQYYKASITEDKFSVSREMIDLSNGYKVINSFKSRTVKNIYERLIALPDAFDILDARIANDIADNRAFPAHVFARSVLRHLIFGSGPLIDEKLLAARLGVEIDQSADWDKLKAKFAEPGRYTGIFGVAWPRWWMFRIAAQWKAIHPAAPLQRLTAEERVGILKKAFKLSRLSAARPMVEGYDQRFWYVCKFLRAPISSTDAVQLSVDRREWQDGVYASLKAILDRLHKAEGYEIHAFERTRIDELMDGLRNAKK
ncbi:MAG: hypothetical protein WBA42_02990 [Mesorhizobium sp.]